MGTKKKNVTISLDDEILKAFETIATKKGIKLSTFLNAKLYEFVSDEVIASNAKLKDGIDSLHSKVDDLIQVIDSNKKIV